MKAHGGCGLQGRLSGPRISLKTKDIDCQYNLALCTSFIIIIIIIIIIIEYVTEQCNSCLPARVRNGINVLSIEWRYEISFNKKITRKLIFMCNRAYVLEYVTELMLPALEKISADLLR